MNENGTEGGFKAPPVTGYNDQREISLKAVNRSKEMELFVSDMVKNMKADTDLAVDPRWLEIAVTDFEKAFMALNRAIFKPASPFHN